MSEMSYLWTTGGAGDGAAEYTRADWQKIIEIIGACHAGEGAGPNWLDTFGYDAGDPETFIVSAGVAIVDGRPYINSTDVTITIPAAVGVGNTRIDRVVLRASWSAQTVRLTRIAGVDAATPSAPAVTQTSGTTYDLLLYQVLVNTSGVLTVTDERAWARVDTNGIEDGALSADAEGRAKMADSFVNAAKIAADSVDKTKAGDGIIQMVKRQGGSSSDWNTSGTTNYTPGAIVLQSFCMSISVSSGAAGLAKSFPTAFSGKPICVGWAVEDNLGFTSSRFSLLLTSISASAFQGWIRADDLSASFDGAYNLHITFMGPE